MPIGQSRARALRTVRHRLPVAGASRSRALFVGWVGRGRRGAGLAGVGCRLRGRLDSGRRGAGLAGIGRRLRGRVGSGRRGAGLAGMGRRLRGRIGSGRRGVGLAGIGRRLRGRVGSGRRGVGLAGIGRRLQGRVGSGRRGVGLSGIGRCLRRRVGSGRRGAGLAGGGRRLRRRIGSGRRLDCQRRGRGWRQLQRDAAPQRCGRADRGPGAVGGEPPARVDGAGVQLPAVAGGCIANLYGRHRRHRIAQQTGARPALFAEAVGHVEHAAVEARQHHHGARRRRIVAQPGYLLVVQVALGQEADGGGEMVPVGAAVGGLVDAVEGGAEQHAGGVVGRQRHAGKVGMRVYLFGGHRLPRHAAVAAHEHGRRSGGGQPPGIGRIDGQ